MVEDRRFNGVRYKTVKKTVVNGLKDDLFSKGKELEDYRKESRNNQRSSSKKLREHLRRIAVKGFHYSI